MLKIEHVQRACSFYVIQGNIDNIILYGYLLGELPTLSYLFQDNQATLETAILKTKSTMSEIARFTVKQNVLEEVESKVNAMVEKLNAVGLELISPLRARRVHSETDYIEGLYTYTYKEFAS